MTDDRSSEDPLAWLEGEQRSPARSRVAFHEQLEILNGVLVDTADTVARAIEPVTRAFLEADRDVVEQWRDESHLVNDRCTRLEESCYLLLARQSPVAGDLRRVVATVRSIPDVERSASLLAHVGTSLDWVHPPAMSLETRDTTRQLGSQAAAVFAGAVRAWRDHDGLAAVELQRTDDEVDLLQKVLLTQIYTGEQGVEEAVSLALIARYYERIADHGVEMARQVAYFLTGERVEHR